MSKRIKDLKLGEYCYMLYVNGGLEVLVLDEMSYIDSKFPNKARLKFHFFGNGNSITFDCMDYLYWIVDEYKETPITVYITKDDAIEELNDIINICKESINIINVS